MKKALEHFYEFGMALLIHSLLFWSDDLYLQNGFGKEITSLFY